MREIFLSQFALVILACQARGGVVFGERPSTYGDRTQSHGQIALIDGTIVFFIGEPPSFTTELEDAFVFEVDAAGDPVTLRFDCQACGTPPPNITW